MKKTLLMGGLLASALFANAQQRLALYEEFSGENCAPCAASNPGLWSLISAPGNDAKVLLIKYQSPIPSAGPIYDINTIFTDNRMNYYSVPFAPYGRLNGAVVGTGQNAGNITLTTQAMIDAASAGVPAFTMTISNPTYNADGQTFTATVAVTAVTAGTYNDLKLRFALAEELDYATAPGTNGETQFHNVVRQMYPSADGQSVASTWTAGQTVNYTITGAIPSYVKPTSVHKFFTAFLQTDGDKVVLQAAKTGDINITLPAVDIASNGISGLSGLSCQLPTTVNPVATLKNTGTTAITSAVIYTKVGSGAWGTPQTFNNLNIAPGATADVTLAPVTITTAGNQTLADSVVLPNNKMDYNNYDNNASATAYVLSNTAAALPNAFDFESSNANFSNWVSWPGTSNMGFPIIKATSGSTPLGYNNSVGLGYFPAYQLSTVGTNGYLIFPKLTLPSGAKAVDFYLSYAQYLNQDGSTTGDKLELVYTTDCGANWTSVWNQTNADLATVAPTASSWIPTQASWKMRSVDVSNVPDGAYFAFKATSGYGNNIFIDNINVRTGAATGISELVSEGSLKVFPNPTSGDLNVTLNLKKGSDVSFSIYNVLGQEVKAVTTKSLNAGTSTTSLNTNDLANGMYYLNISTEAGSTQQKFTKQ